MNTSWFVVLAMLALTAIGLLPRRTFSSPLINAFRVLFPSWRFFGAPGLDVDLLVRRVSEDGQCSDWTSALTCASRSAYGILWNPQATQRWLEKSLLLTFIRELESLEHPETHVVERLESFQLVDQIAREHLLSIPGIATQRSHNHHYEFQIQSRAEGDLEMSQHIAVPARSFVSGYACEARERGSASC